MAKAIEQTPTLEGKEANRFLDILFNVDNITPTKQEEEIKKMLKTIPNHLKL